MVVDADALNALSAHSERMSELQHFEPQTAVRLFASHLAFDPSCISSRTGVHGIRARKESVAGEFDGEAVDLHAEPSLARIEQQLITLLEASRTKDDSPSEIAI